MSQAETFLHHSLCLTGTTTSRSFVQSCRRQLNQLYCKYRVTEIIEQICNLCCKFNPTLDSLRELALCMHPKSLLSCKLIYHTVETNLYNNHNAIKTLPVRILRKDTSKWDKLLTSYLTSAPAALSVYIFSTHVHSIFQTSNARHINALSKALA